MGRVVQAFVLVLVAVLPTGTSIAAQETASARVRLIATGGTISNREGGRLTAKELIELVPNLTNYAQVEAEQFANVSSSQLTLNQWLQLSQRVNHVLAEDPGLAGVVVTSGTDTLEETAYFLHLTVRSERPVVVVGAMRNPSTLGYEGAANLQQAFRVAAAPQSRGKGALVVLNGEINSAREVTKTDSLRLHTFATRGYGVLGLVDRDGVVYYRNMARRHTYRSEFDLTGVTELPRVDVILVYQGASGDLIESVVDAGAHGIVVAAAGAGATSGTQNEAIAYAHKRGVFTVISTRSGSGRVIPRQLPPLEQDMPEGRRLSIAHRIAAQDLAPLKARILLMLALTRTSDVTEIRRMFSEY